MIPRQILTVLFNQLLLVPASCAVRTQVDSLHILEHSLIILLICFLHSVQLGILPKEDFSHLFQYMAWLLHALLPDLLV